MPLFPSIGKPKAIKPYEVSLYQTRGTLDPRTYTPEMANLLAPWTQTTGALTTALAGRAAATDAESGLYDTLTGQAKSDLALGGALNEDEIRQATQGSRAAYASRGMTDSGRGILGEVLARAQFSNARRRERQGFALSVEGLRQQRQAGTTSLLGALGGLNTAGNVLGEEIRQFELEREDALKQKDKEAAVNLKIGKDQAAAAKSAGRTSAIGSALGAVGSVIGAFL